jgi:hypothetical protein
MFTVPFALRAENTFVSACCTSANNSLLTPFIHGENHPVSAGGGNPVSEAL